MGGGPRTSHALRKAQATSTPLGASPRPVILRRLRAPSSKPPLDAETEPIPIALAAPLCVPLPAVAAVAAATGGGGGGGGHGQCASLRR